MGLTTEVINLMVEIGAQKKLKGTEKLAFVVESIKRDHGDINTLDIIELVDALIDTEQGKIKFNKRALWKFLC